MEPIFPNKKLNFVGVTFYGQACTRACVQVLAHHISTSFDVFPNVYVECIGNFCKATEPKEWHQIRFTAVYMRNVIPITQVNLLILLCE